MGLIQKKYQTLIRREDSKRRSMQSVLQHEMKGMRKRYLVWHNQQTVTLSDRPRLHFSHYNSAHIFIFINYWHSALSIKMLHLAYNQYNISTSYINIFSMKGGLELNGFNNNVEINYQSYIPVTLSKDLCSSEWSIK